MLEPITMVLSIYWMIGLAGFALGRETRRSRKLLRVATALIAAAGVVIYVAPYWMPRVSFPVPRGYAWVCFALAAGLYGAYRWLRSAEEPGDARGPSRLQGE